MTEKEIRKQIEKELKDLNNPRCTTCKNKKTCDKFVDLIKYDLCAMSYLMDQLVEERMISAAK